MAATVSASIQPKAYIWDPAREAFAGAKYPTEKDAEVYWRLNKYVAWTIPYGPQWYYNWVKAGRRATLARLRDEWKARSTASFIGYMRGGLNTVGRFFFATGGVGPRAIQGASFFYDMLPGWFTHWIPDLRRAWMTPLPNGDMTDGEKLGKMVAVMLLLCFVVWKLQQRLRRNIAARRAARRAP